MRHRQAELSSHVVWETNALQGSELQRTTRGADHEGLRCRLTGARTCEGSAKRAHAGHALNTLQPTHYFPPIPLLPLPAHSVMHSMECAQAVSAVVWLAQVSGASGCISSMGERQHLSVGGKGEVLGEDAWVHRLRLPLPGGPPSLPFHQMEDILLYACPT